MPDAYAFDMYELLAVVVFMMSNGEERKPPQRPCL